MINQRTGLWHFGIVVNSGKVTKIKEEIKKDENKIDKIRS